MTYNIFDAHCDTVSKIFNGSNETLIRNSMQFSVENTKKYGKYIQVLAMWIDPDKDAGKYTYSLLDDTLKHLRECDINPVLSASDLQDTRKFGVILAIEGADAINTLQDINYFYNKGVRLITLTWNGKNSIGCGALSDCTKGLTDFGREAVLRFNELGIVTDVSHLNENGFYDVMEVTKKPVVASHSCSASLCSHKRNLTDKQFQALMKNRGVCGINFYPEFLSNDGKAGIADIVKHIEYFCSLGGEKHIGFGSDFDGINCLPEGISSNKDIYMICDELLRLNYTEEIVKDIAFNNFYNLFCEILG